MLAKFVSCSACELLSAVRTDNRDFGVGAVARVSLDNERSRGLLGLRLCGEQATNTCRQYQSLCRRLLRTGSSGQPLAKASCDRSEPGDHKASTTH